MDKVVVIGIQVGVCGWCGEDFLNDLRDLGWKIGSFIDCNVLVIYPEV